MHSHYTGNPGEMEPHYTGSDSDRPGRAGVMMTDGTLTRRVAALSGAIDGLCDARPTHQYTLRKQGGREGCVE